MGSNIPALANESISWWALTSDPRVATSESDADELEPILAGWICGIFNVLLSVVSRTVVGKGVEQREVNELWHESGQ